MTIEFEKAAAAMFGDSHPTKTTPSVDRVEHSDLAATLFPDQAKHDLQRQADQLARQRAQFAPTQNAEHEPTTIEEKAQAMYGSTDPTLTHRDATQAIVNSALEDHLADPKTAGEIAAEWAATFQRHNLNATESKELADIGAQVLKSPPTPELVTQWTETAITQLQAEYGVKGAGQALQDARAYVASMPGAADMIDALGLGAHPKLVALAAARGRAMRLAGKLR